MKYTKIITHAGTHHADEILAIAVVLYFIDMNLEVERNYTPTQEEINDPSVIILDITRILDPSISVFDHHQSGDIQATNVLVLDHFCKDEKLKTLLKEYLFNYVDAVDRGKVIEDRSDELKVPTFNSIIRNLNNVEGGFDIALRIACDTLNAYIETSKKRIESEERWGELDKNSLGFAIQYDNDFIVGWRELAEPEGIKLLIHPNPRNEGSYSMTTISTDVLKIPKHPSYPKIQHFLHNNQFVAAYDSLEDAVSHAKEILLDESDPYYKIFKIRTENNED